jgi:hypothetical protein
MYYIYIQNTCIVNHNYIYIIYYIYYIYILYYIYIILYIYIIYIINICTTVSASRGRFLHRDHAVVDGSISCRFFRPFPSHLGMVKTIQY